MYTARIGLDVAADDVEKPSPVGQELRPAMLILAALRVEQGQVLAPAPPRVDPVEARVGREDDDAGVIPGAAARPADVGQRLDALAVDVELS